MKQDSHIKNATRGGQITFNDVHMYFQVLKVIFICVIISIVIFNLIWFYLVNTSYQKRVATTFHFAKINYLFDKKGTQNFKNSSGKMCRVLSKDILLQPQVKKVVQEIYYNVIDGFIYSFIFGGFIFVFAYSWFSYRGKKAKMERILNNYQLVEPKVINNMLRKRNQISPIKIANINMVKDSESEHIFVHGATGSGKSTLIKNLIKQIIEMGHKFIVFDKSCDLAHHFHNEKISRILNPFDLRSPAWTVWNDSRDSADINSIAEALMPTHKSAQDPFWVNSARLIFSATVFEMRNDPNRSNIKLLRNLLTADLSQMEKFLKDTEAATLVSESIEKTAVSIKAVLATYLRSLKYLKDDGPQFSIRDWIENDDERRGLFITSMADKHPILRPLNSMWIDIAINATMSLAPNKRKPIWIILDECHSLHQLPFLAEGANELRKFGGRLIIGTTSFAGLCDIYGNDCANSIIEQFNTSVYFRTPRAERALWISKELGESEIEEVHESVSFGANTSRDGVSISKQKVRRPAVPYTDIQSMDKLQAFVKLPGSYPITKVKFSIFPKSSTAEPGYIAREINEDVFKDVTEIEETYILNPNKAPEYQDPKDKLKSKNITGNSKRNKRVKFIGSNEDSSPFLDKESTIDVTMDPA